MVAVRKANTNKTFSSCPLLAPACRPSGASLPKDDSCLSKSASLQLDFKTTAAQWNNRSDFSSLAGLRSQEQCAARDPQFSLRELLSITKPIDKSYWFYKQIVLGRIPILQTFVPSNSPEILFLWSFYSFRFRFQKFTQKPEDVPLNIWLSTLNTSPPAKTGSKTELSHWGN